MPSPLVAVLAGGRGSRLGGGKPGAPLAGRPLIHWPLAAARAAGLDAVVVAKPGTPLPPVDVPVWTEPPTPVHPLLGLVTALERAGGRDVIALGCDMPFLTPQALLQLAAAAAPAAAPDEPLFARYGPAHLPVLAGALEDQASLRGTLRALEPAAVHVPAGVLRSVNDPAALAAAAAELAGWPR